MAAATTIIAMIHKRKKEGKKKRKKRDQQVIPSLKRKNQFTNSRHDDLPPACPEALRNKMVIVCNKITKSNHFIDLCDNHKQPPEVF